MSTAKRGGQAIGRGRVEGDGPAGLRLAWERAAADGRSRLDGLAIQSGGQSPCPTLELRGRSSNHAPHRHFAVGRATQVVHQCRAQRRQSQLVGSDSAHQRVLAQLTKLRGAADDDACLRTAQQFVA